MPEKKKKETRRVSQAEIQQAELLFCERRWTPERIAEALERDKKTVYAWRDKYKWEETRNLFETGPTELKKILMSAAIRIAKGENRKAEDGAALKEVDADAISKIMKAYDYMCKQASPAVCRDVLIELDLFSSQIDPEKAAANVDIHKQFLLYKIQQEGV